MRTRQLLNFKTVWIKDLYCRNLISSARSCSVYTCLNTYPHGPLFKKFQILKCLKTQHVLYFLKARDSRISNMIIILSYHHMNLSSYQFDGGYCCPMDAIFHVEGTCPALIQAENTMFVNPR